FTYREEDLPPLLEFVEEQSRTVLGLDMYPNEFRLVDKEDMIAAMGVIGMPDLPPWWGYGKRIVIETARNKAFEERFMRPALPYELVVNTNPCISYNMRSNS